MISVDIIVSSTGWQVREFNQALFVKLYLDEDGVRAERAAPFATLPTCAAPER
jgi:hypothetical protein